MDLSKIFDKVIRVVNIIQFCYFFDFKTYVRASENLSDVQVSQSDLS